MALTAVITPEEIYIRTPGNKRIQRVEANISGKNKRDYPVLVFFDNDELEWNGNQKPVCYYNRSWAKLGFDHKLQLPLAGEELPKLHQYNLVPSTCHHSDAEESDNRKGKGKRVDRNDSEDEDSPSCQGPMALKDDVSNMLSLASYKSKVKHSSSTH